MFYGKIFSDMNILKLKIGLNGACPTEMQHAKTHADFCPFTITTYP